MNHVQRKARGGGGGGVLGGGGGGAKIAFQVGNG